MEKDEEFFIATYMFSEAGVHEVGKALWDKQMKRTLFRRRGVRHAIRSRMKVVSLNTPAGLYLGDRYGIEIDYERLSTVVGKIVRGLYFFEYKEPLALEAAINSMWLNTKRAADETRPFVSQLSNGRKQWPGVFRYKCARVEKATDQSLWLILFFEFAAWWAITGKDLYKAC